ncbi:hypothetical protein [Pelagibius marinus]|uniref:hypothetical protein n=1 Tax=Pelagibius marinus TaxID=2762760 RepID=UPI0018732704|nr:hypothetical protein [Pelagibius marinus]
MHRQQTFTYILIVAGVLGLGIAAGLGLFETLGERQAAASQSTRRDPQATAVYDSCMTSIAASRLKDPSVQQAICNCYVDEATQSFEPEDYSIIVAAMSGDTKRVEAEIRSLSRNEQIAFTKRMKHLTASAFPRCMKTGIKAAENARNAL